MLWISLVFIVFIEQVMMTREGKNIMICYQTCLLLCMEDQHFIYMMKSSHSSLCLVYFEIQIRHFFLLLMVSCKKFCNVKVLFTLNMNISMHILHTIFYAFPKVDKENLFSNQELLIGRNKMLVTLMSQRVKESQ